MSNEEKMQEIYECDSYAIQLKNPETAKGIAVCVLSESKNGDCLECAAMLHGSMEVCVTATMGAIESLANTLKENGLTESKSTILLSAIVSKALSNVFEAGNDISGGALN